jgi:hypothetical protein
MMTVLRHILDQVEPVFKENPYRFFTEHDIHSELALITTNLLSNEGSLFVKTKDGNQVGRVHHEYPTPFRCLMEHYNFRMVTEDEFKREKLKNPRFAAKRGRIDLVVLNSDYVSSNTLNIVSGKRYKDLLESATQQKFPALDLAIEVVYHPTMDERPHAGIMKRRVESIVQDYEKLLALMKFRQIDDLPFCKEAAMLFFSNTGYRVELERTLSSIKTDEKVSLSSFICPKTA